MKQVPKLWVRQARAWGSWAVPPPSARGVLRVQVGTGPQARSSWERVAGLLQTPVPSAEAHSVPEGFLYTACPGSVWARALYTGGSGSWEPTGAPLLGTAAVFSLLTPGPGPALLPSRARAHLFPRASLPRAPRV